MSKPTGHFTLTDKGVLELREVSNDYIKMYSRSERACDFCVVQELCDSYKAIRGFLDDYPHLDCQPDALEKNHNAFNLYWSKADEHEED